MNLLSALALIDAGVREILPFIRYISQYIDFEFDSIKKQDKGKGVVCAATWYVYSLLISGDSLTKAPFLRLMPIALVTLQVLFVRIVPF